jgi:APA family basic amino acid/polyamine antiporter
VAAVAGLVFALWALLGAGLEAAGASVVLMLTALPLYWLRFGGGDLT